ncbi:AAA family ATPase [Martelella mediterranea]|uniref:DNA transposition AAA+ family ATPase n=1 Tax=Martelella mediterranea TaxID=293089 RepID=A0A4R3NUJ7_9HYPH|nr:AAA family ATPase [Martelella mediterranea]TCT39600.1 hypothetical protein EDC90_101298 [Martelella mediterranea]
MNIHTGTSQSKSNWERPIAGPELSSNRSQADIDLWWSLIDRVIETATTNGWTKAEVARRCGMADGTFSQWVSGKYNGRLDKQNQTVRQWLEEVEDQTAFAASIPQSPTFLKTQTAREVVETLNWAQITSDFVIVTLAAGMGKTIACRHYCATHPHAYLATVSPHTKTVHAMLVELAAELNVQEHNPAKLTRAIGKKLERIGSGTLLIVDEAQNLVDDAINQLRHFVDIYGCGVALVGNDEVYGRFTNRSEGRSYAQLKRRIGKRLNRQKPLKQDLETFIAAWGVSDPAAIKLLAGIGSKGGALGQIDKTMKLAAMLALGRGEDVGVKHIETAWRNRDVEDIA